MCLDKRTGRIIHDEQMKQNIGYYELAAMPDEQTVELRLQRNAIRLKFTDDPIPPESEKPSGAENKDATDKKDATQKPQETPR